MKILIRVTRKTEYASIVEMSEDKFKQLEADLQSGDKKKRKAAEREANSRIDTSDWQDDDLDSVDEFAPYQ